MSVACIPVPVVLLVLTCIAVVSGDTTLTFTDLSNFNVSLSISSYITRSWVDCLYSLKSCDLIVESTNNTKSYSAQYISTGSVTSNDSLQKNVSFCQWYPKTSTPLTCIWVPPDRYNTYSNTANRCTFFQFINETNYTNYMTVLWNQDCTVHSTDKDFLRFSDCGTNKVRELSTTTTAVTLLTTSSTTGANNIGVIAGCVIGGFVVLIIIILISVLVCLVKGRRQKTLEKSVRQDGGYTEVDLTLGSAYTEIDLNLDSQTSQDCTFHRKSPSSLNGSIKNYQKIYVVLGDNNRDEDRDVKKSAENLDKMQKIETNALGAHMYSYARVIKNKSQDGGQFIPGVTQTDGQVGPPDVTQTDGQVGPPDVTQTDGQVGPPDVTQTDGQVGPDLNEYSRLGEQTRVLHNLYNMVSVSGQSLSLDTGSGQHHSTQNTEATASDRPIEITVLRPRGTDHSN